MKSFNCFLVGLIFITLLSFISFGQTQPEEIDVRSISITKLKATTGASTNIDGVDSNNEDFRYSGLADSVFYGSIPYLYCQPCRQIGVFETNTFGSGFRVQFGTNSLTEIIFSLDSSESSSMYMNQRLLTKRKNFQVKGNTRLEGRMEIRVSGKLVAFDNDVVLVGGYVTDFYKPIYLQTNRHPGKYTYFNGIKFTLEDNRSTAKDE